MTSGGEYNIQKMIDLLKSLNDGVLVCEFSIAMMEIVPELDVCLSLLDRSTESALNRVGTSFQVLSQDLLYDKYGRCGLVLEQLDEFFIDVLISTDQSKWNIMNESSDWKLIERNSQYIFVTPKLESGKEYFFKLILIPKINTWLYYDVNQLFPHLCSSGMLPLLKDNHSKEAIEGCVLGSLHPNMFHLKFDNYPLFHIGCTIVKSPTFRSEISPMLQVIVEACNIKKYEEPVWREITLIGHEINSEQLKTAAIDPKSGYKARLFIACKFDRFRHGNILPKSNPVTIPSSLMMWSEIPHAGELSAGYDTFLRVTSKTPIFFVFLPHDNYSKLYEFRVQARLKNSKIESDWVYLDMEPADGAFQLQKMSGNIVKCSPKSNYLLGYGKVYSVRITARYNNCTPIIVKEFVKTIPTFNYISNLTTDILERNGGVLMFNSGSYFVYLMLDGTIIMVDPTIQYTWNETRMYSGTFRFSNLTNEVEMRKFFEQSIMTTPLDEQMQDDNLMSETVDVNLWKYITSVDSTFHHHPPHDLRLPKQAYNYYFHIIFDGKYNRYRLLDNSELFSDVKQSVSFNWRNEEHKEVILMDYYSHNIKLDERRTCGPNKSNEYPQRIIQWYSNFYISNSRKMSDLVFEFTS